MKKLATAIGASIALGALGGGAALAGYKSVGPVGVNTVARQAWGSLGGARASADANQLMEIYFQGTAGGSQLLVMVARDANNVWGICTSNDATLINAMKSVENDSYVTFSWDVNGKCTNTEVRSTSYLSPKVP